MLMKNNFLSKAYGGVTVARRKLNGLGLPRQWKVMTSTLLLLFTFAIGNVWAAYPETIWSSDMQETITGVNQTKGRNSDSWSTSLSLSWASGYTKGFVCGGSSSALTLDFNSDITVHENYVLRIYWGAANSKTLSLFINGASSANATQSPATNVLSILEYEFTGDLTLDKFKIAVTGSTCYFFKAELVDLGPKPSTGETTITFAFPNNAALTAEGSTNNRMSTITNLSTSVALTGLTTNTNDKAAAGCTAKMENHIVANDGTKYADLQFTISDGYTFTPTALTFKWRANSPSMKAKVLITDGTTTLTSNESTSQGSTSKSDAFTFDDGKLSGDSVFSGTVHIKVFMYGVTSKRSYLEGPFSITGTVAVACQDVSAPEDLSCSSTKTSSSLTFTWTAAENASSYDVKLWTNSACTGDPAFSDNVTTTSKTFSGLNPSTPYYCKVQSKGNGTTYCAEGGVTDVVSGETDAASGYLITKSSVSNGSIAVTVGDEPATSANANDQVDIVATPNTGYQFGSWSIYETATPGNTIDPHEAAASTYFEMPAAAVTVGATFNAINYAITHTDATNGDYTIKVGDEEPVGTDATANYGQTITLAATPASSAYYHAGWTVTGDVSGDNIEVTENAFSMPAEAVTIAATFAENKTITYNANNGTGTMAPTVDHGVIHLRANTYTRDGYVFAGWATSQANANIGTIAYADGAEYNLTDNAELFAVWYTVLYSYVPTGAVSEDELPASTVLVTSTGGTMTVTVAPMKYQTPGLMFAYNSSAKTKGKVKVELDNALAEGDVIIANLINPDATKARGVTLYKEDGSTSVATWTATSTDPYTRSLTITNSHALKGETSFQLERKENSYLRSLYVAKFVAPSIDYTVTINPDGGAYAVTPEGWTYNEGVYTKTIANATSFSAPEGLAKEGYVLTGWKDEGDNDITFPQMISGNITFVAQWAPTYTATLSPDGGSTDAEGWTYDNVNDKYTKSGLLATTEVTLPTMTKDGYNFVKWTADQNVTINAATVEAGEDIAEGAVVKLSANTTFTASWTEIPKSTDATLSDLTVGGETVDGFDPDDIEYDVVLPLGTTVVPTVDGTANDTKAKSVVVTAATSLPGSTTVVVTAEDNSTTKTYTINFSVATSKDIVLVYKTNETTCAGTASAVAKASSFSTYLTLDAGTESSTSVNTTNATNGRITISAKAGYAFKAMSFYGKVQDGSCGVSLDGAAATTLELDPQSTTDACYEDVFSNAEVRTFSIINTGTNGVWIRNMKLTVIQACTPISLAWDEEPVEFEVGKAGYAIAATANNGGTIAYSSTDGDVISVNGSTGALTVSALGSVTLKAATAEGDGTTYCANGGENIEISKAVNTYYLVKFDAQNGEATDEVKYFSGDAAIAQPTDPSFPGHTFQGWFDAASAGNPVAFPLTPSASRTIYAQWTADCAGATITTQPEGTSYLTGRTATALVCEATAGAGGALTYEWFTCDDELKTNPVAATATPSTAVAGTYYYFCKVTEEGCAVEAFSNVVTITVADKDAICIIKSTPTSGTEATVDGVYQGNAYFKGRESGKKLNSKYDYVAVQLKDGFTFLATDKVVLNQTADLSSGDISKFYIFTEVPADGKSYVTVNNASPLKGDNWFAMPAEMEGESALYIGRVDANCNPSVGYLAVYRACAPILNKVTVNGAEGKPNALNQVVFEVAASTTQSQLEAIAFDWVSNDDAWTAAHAPVAANAWEFGVANEVTFTDKDGDQSVYTITVNKAAASTNVELATLTVNGNAVTVVPGQAVYNYELPYGTSAAPTVAATAEDANAGVGTITQAASTTGSATFTVTAEDGTTTRDYTINFSVSLWKEVVIWDGSTMSAVATSPDATTGMAWETVGFGSISNYAVSYEGKDYTKCLPSGGSASATRNIALTVPAGYVAKFYVVGGSHSDDEERSAFIATSATKTDTHEGILTIVSPKRVDLAGGTSAIVSEGTYYLNPAASFDFYEIRAYLRKGYVRTSMLGNGVLGTVCVDHNVAIEDIQGATFYELQGREPEYGKLAFDEIVSCELEAGAPYVFQAHGDKLVLFYGNTKVDDPVDKGNGMYGTFVDQTLTELDGIYYFAKSALWSCVDLTSLNLPANRAYVKLSEIGPVADPNPAPGRRRITLGVQGEQVATGIDQVPSDQVQSTKVLIDGHLYILRGEKMYDAKGQLVK